MAFQNEASNPLSSANVPYGDTPPWKPRVAAIISGLFGPLAGALVSSANLKRLGEPRKAKQVLVYTALACIPLSVVLIRVPDEFGKIVGSIMQAAGAGIFFAVQRKEFAAWERAAQAAAAQMEPGAKQPATASEWKAVGRGFLGMVALVAMIFAMGFAQSALVDQYVQRGDELMDAKMYVEAEREYQAALWIDPSAPVIHFSLMQLYGTQEKWDQAIASARAGLRAQPDNALAHYLLGLQLTQVGDGEGAIKEYCESLRLEPDNNQAQQALRLTLVLKNDPRAHSSNPCQLQPPPAPASR